MMGWLLKLATGNPVTLIYLALGIAVAAAGIGGTAAWKFQGMRLDAAKGRTQTVQAAFDTFKAQVAAEGKIAQQKADTQAAADKLKKEQADASHKAAVALLSQRVSSLRYDREHSGKYGVSAPGPVPGSPDRACFKSAEFERAVSGFVEGAANLIEECGSAITDLNTAKTWAQGR